ncbi:BglG family transcription antiterminator, partial [Streptococcus oralis]|uniref:BglG family transcription antiterminator n=1 Tax=Streptococcus oralis TaxID=1303 RepID=UPI00077D8BEF
MVLDKTSCELLLYLLNQETPKTIMTISKELGQSRRKVYYHIDKINDELEDPQLYIISLPRVGICLSTSQKLACRKLLSEVNPYDYVMSGQERMQLMLLFIGVAKERITIEKLMDLTEVSRNTVLNDLNTIRYQLSLEQYQVTLQVSKSQGYYLQAHSLNKIQYLQSLLYHIFLEGSSAFVSIVEEKIKERLQSELLLSEKVNYFLKEQVPVVEQGLGKKINHHEVTFMLQVLPYLLLGCDNVARYKEKHHDIEKEFSLIRKRIEYRVSQKLGLQLFDTFGISLSELKISLIAVLLLSYRKDRDVHAESEDFHQLKVALEDFIWCFESQMKMEIENKDNLLRNLLIHCKALLFRKTYGIFSKNPLTKQIRSKYLDLFIVTRKCSKILEEAWFVSLTDDEIAYLTIHIGGFLRYTPSDQVNSKKIYLICDEGVGVSKLLLKQCRFYLPNEQIGAVFTTEQFKSVEDIAQVDLIITTNEHLESKFPILKVNPILETEDILQIVDYLKHNVFRKDGKSFRDELSNLLASYISDKQTVMKLQDELQDLINR